MKLEHERLLIRIWAYRQLPAYHSWLALSLLNVCHRRGGGAEMTAGTRGGPTVNLETLNVSIRGSAEHGGSWSPSCSAALGP